jgi:tetratricopeptide (TPR) repeat protein
MTEEEKTFEPLFNAAIEARDRGDLDQALALFGTVLEQCDEQRLSGIVHGMVGAILLFDKNAITEAERHYRQAVRLMPRAELGSLGLFHALARQERIEEALEEMIRYLSSKDSQEYRSLLRDAYPEHAFPAGRKRELVAAAHRLVKRWDSIS